MLDRDGELDHSTLLQPGTGKCCYGIPDPRKNPNAHMLGYMREILREGYFSKLEIRRKQKDFELLEELRQIHGVGAATANMLVKKGVTSLDELRPGGSKHNVLLNETQQMQRTTTIFSCACRAQRWRRSLYVYTRA